ncbi:MAG: HAD family hydrolase [Pseudomonadota bacterium]
MTECVRIAMWSGPRNLSTTMMRSFGARADTSVWDEPFYAAYLAKTGLDHPLRAETLDACEADAEKVAHSLAHGAVRTPIFYQKQMTHHILPDTPPGWMRACRHAFLIRHPARVLASFRAKYDRVDLDAIGFPQQLSLYETLIGAGGNPPVIDADDILDDPETALRLLCRALEIPWDVAMLTWPKGPHPADGPWAPHWYGQVRQSTGFGPPPQEMPRLSGELQAICEAALPIYQRLYAERIRVQP